MKEGPEAKVEEVEPLITETLKVVNNFILGIRSIATGGKFNQILMLSIHKKALEEYRSFIKDYCEQYVADDGITKMIKIKGSPTEYFKLQNEAKSAAKGAELTNRSLIVSMVSQYDAFLGSLIRTFLSAIPEKLRSKERTMSFEEILQFDSIDELKSHLIEEQIDTVLRQSHRDQFAWLENRFSIPLKKLTIWPDFIELTQRRNLYVHTDGRVTRQYIKICREEGVDEGKLPAHNSILKADFGYIEKSHRVLYEIGLKLSQVLLHKSFGSRIEAADDFLNGEAYNHIVAGEYDTAIMLLDFGLDVIPKKSTEERRLTFVVNRANAYRLKGDRAKCADLLAGQDWSVLSLKFQLAEAALREDVTRVVELMNEIGSNDKRMSSRTYREWPLFNGLRESVNFQEAFAALFGEALNEVRQLEGTEGDDASPKALLVN